jgi:hypothetical protein
MAGIEWKFFVPRDQSALAIKYFLPEANRCFRSVHLFTVTRKAAARLQISLV